MIVSPPALQRTELLRRARIARDMLHRCQICERRCNVDRIAGERAPCGLGDETWCFKRHLSFAEEAELLPSYMVYMGGCNFRCKFCVQAPSCFSPDLGVRMIPSTDAADFARAASRGARSINLLGGEPSLHLHTILEMAAAADVPLPLALNSNMYMTPEVIELLDGVVSLYIADFKFGNDACALDLAGVERYVEVVGRNLLLAAATTDVLVRHLVMPGHIDCCLRPVAMWMAEHLPETPFSLMTGYVPAWRARSLPVLGQTLSAAEVERVESIVRGYGLARVDQA